jgi:RNA polymerase sigma factor (sigma-70 family)
MDQKELKKYLGYVRVQARNFSRAYPDLFTFEDLYSAGEEGLALAINKYDPSKGHFPRYVWLYIKGYIQVAVRKRLQDKSRSVTLRDEDGDTTNAVELAGVDASQDEDISYREMMLDIRRQIDKLPSSERDYAVLTLDGWNGSEVAERMGVSDQRVAQLRKVVVEKLQKWNKAA